MTTNAPLIMKRYYLVYLRKSTESEDRQVQSIEDQRAILVPLARQKGLEILEIFGEAKSAKDPGRIEFNKLVNLIDTRGDIRGILCWKLNRLFRNPEDEGVIRQRLSDGRIMEIVTPAKTYLEADSDFAMAVEGAQGQRFIRELREDTKRGVESKLTKGLAPILAPPGYYNDKHKNQGQRDILPDNNYFPLMRQVLELGLTGKHSIQSLYEKAKELEIRNNRGSYISRTRMGELIHNPFYVGDFIYGGIRYKGVHRPMLTREEFDLLQDIFGSRNRSRPKKGRWEVAYDNALIRCVCGRSMSPERKVKTYKSGKKGVFVFYSCNRHHYHPDPMCPRSRISERDLERQIHDLLGRIKISERMVKFAIKKLQQKHEQVSQAKTAHAQAVRRSLDDNEKRRKNLFNLMTSPLNLDRSLLSDTEYQQEKYKLEQEKIHLEQSLKGVDEGTDNWRDLAYKVFDFASKAQDRFLKGDQQTKKTICQIFGQTFEVNGKSLQVTPRTPFKYLPGTAPLNNGFLGAGPNIIAKNSDIPSILPSKKISGWKTGRSLDYFTSSEFAKERLELVTKFRSFTLA